MRLRIGIAAAASGAVAATLLVAGLPRWRPVLWGADAWGYLGSPALLACLAAALLAAGLVWIAPTFPSRTGSRAAAGLILAPVFFLVRDRWHLLGDGQLWLGVLDRARVHHPHEPLAFAGAALATAGLAGAPPAAVALRAELWSVALGTVAVALLAVLAARLAPGDRGRWAAFGLFLASGTLQFGFGYVEAYPLLWVMVILYLVLAAGAVMAGGSVVAASGAWGLAAATHGTGFLLAPSLLAVHVVCRTRPRIWILSGLAALVPVAGAYAGLPHLLAAAPGTSGDASSALRGVSELWGQLRIYPHGGAAWFLDQWNRWTLLAPLALGLVAAGWILPRRGEPGEPESTRLAWVLALAAVGLALPALLLDTEGSRGAAMDWDASAVAAVPLSALAALGIGGRVEASAALRRVVAVGLGLGVFGTACFVAVNAQPEAAVRRVTGLMQAPAWTDRTRSLAAETLAAATRGAGRPEEARDWYVRAAELDPGSARKVTNAAILLAQEGEHRRAAGLYTALLDRGGGGAEAWFRLGRELEAVGSPDSAVAAYGEAIRLDSRGAAPRNHLARLILMRHPDRAGRARAAELLRESLALEPDQPGAGELRRVLAGLREP